jgi:hypothetical protein
LSETWNVVNAESEAIIGTIQKTDASFVSEWFRPVGHANQKTCSTMDEAVKAIFDGRDQVEIQMIKKSD